MTRTRRTNAELDEIDAAIMAAVRDEHPCTLRSVYYRVVSAGAIEKTESGYNVIGRQVLKLRRAGVLPYSWITDGTRYVFRPDTWASPQAALRHTHRTYRRELWANQPTRVEVFSEKDALVGVVESITDEFDVPLGVLRGYASESFAWRVAESVRHAGKPTRILNLGDHDPSGVNAWEDFARKVHTFADLPKGQLKFTRIAVTPKQIERYSLPTRPTKRTDTRAASFDGESVEVDAIPPNELRAIVRRSIEKHIDKDALAMTRELEQNDRDLLSNMIGHL